MDPKEEPDATLFAVLVLRDQKGPARPVIGEIIGSKVDGALVTWAK